MVGKADWDNKQKRANIRCADTISIHKYYGKKTAKHLRTVTVQSENKELQLNAKKTGVHVHLKTVRHSCM